MRLPAGCQSIANAQDDVPPAFGGIEDAGTIGKPASLVAEFAHLAISQVQSLQGINSLCHFLAIGTDVLHWSSTYAAGDATHALHTGAVAGYGTSREFIPIHTGPDLKHNLAVLIMFLDCRDAHLEH